VIESAMITDDNLFQNTEHQTFDDVDKELAVDCANFHYDAYGFVMHMFDWGHGELEGFTGPDEWQKQLLLDISKKSYDHAFDGVSPVLPIREAVASGHGIGKSAITSWIILWIMSTRPFALGTVTSNTSVQLETKTWAELGKWRNRCMTGHWFEYTSGRGSMKMYHKSYPKEWFVSAQTCREENSESFAGQHAENSTSFYIFDEASAVPDKIFEVAEGGLTDGEPMMFAFGNPTRNDGRFADIFSSPNWNTRQIDSRTCKMTNKALLNQWVDEHGEDSDFVKVRVKGEFPSAGEMQFIPADLVELAMKRPIPPVLSDDPLIMSFDVARGGGDDCRIGFRRGFDARSENSYKITYENSRDSMKVVSKVIMVIDRHKPDVMIIDETGVGGPVLDRLKQLGHNAHGVHFGGVADRNDRYINKTAEMGYRLRRWLMDGGCLPFDKELKRQLISRNFEHDTKDRLVLEKKEDIKERLGCSPDWGDQIYMLFAFAKFTLIERANRLNQYPLGTRSKGVKKDRDPFN